MSAAESLHFASELKIAANGIIAEDAKTVNDRDRAARPPDDIRGLELQVLGVGHRQNDRLDPRKRRRQLFLDPHVDQLQIKRLKKRKLLIKDLIQRLESDLIPDLDA
mgnify:CR=1 FL=1